MLTSFSVFAWLVAAVIQLYYWLLVVWPLESYRGKQRDSFDPVSVIICAREPADQLADLIRQILGQDHPAFELIVVNDGPHPAVSALCEEFKEDGRFSVLAYDRTERGGKKLPLSKGIAQAAHDWILLTDSDCAVRPGWIASMMRYTSAKSKVVLGYSPMNLHSGFTAKLSAFDTIYIAAQYLGWALRDRVYMGVGRNLLYHKSLFEEIGGFHEHRHIASGDDDLLIQKLSLMTTTNVCLEAPAIVYSEPKRTFKALVRQKLRHISTASLYDKPSSSLVTVMGASYIAFWLLIPFVPVFAMGIPALIAGVCVITQWWVFHRVSERLEARAFVPLFPMWAVLYALFLLWLGLLTAVGRTPKTWN